VYVFANYYEGTNGAKSLFRLTKNWTGSTVAWNTPWSTKGGDLSTPAVATSSNTVINTWEDYNVTAAIKDMVENSGANYGFLLKFDSMTPAKGASIRSSEYSQAAQRPKLVVTYEPPSSILPNQFGNDKITGACKVTINNIQGRRIASLSIQNVDQLNQIKAKLSSGVHIVNITTPDKKSIRKIWVIQ
jgi:hypothetical protein